MFNHESWKPIYFGGQNVKDQGHNSRGTKTAGMGFCTGFFLLIWLLDCLHGTLKSRSGKLERRKHERIVRGWKSQELKPREEIAAGMESQ